METKELSKRYRAGMLTSEELGKAGLENAIAIALDGDQPRREIVYTSGKLDFEEQTRRVKGLVITTDNVNRGGSIVISKGVQLKAFRQNPRLLFSHDDVTPEGNIGSVVRVRREQIAKVRAEGLLADEEYFPGELNPRAEFIFRMVIAGGYPARSIGWLPIEMHIPQKAEERAELGLDEWGGVHTKWELLEESVVTIPKLADAVTNALIESVQPIWAAALKAEGLPPEVKSWAHAALAPTEEELERIERHRARGFVALPQVVEVSSEVLYDAAAGLEEHSAIEALPQPTGAQVDSLAASVRQLNMTLEHALAVDGEVGEPEGSEPTSEPAPRGGKPETVYEQLLAVTPPRS